MVGTLLRPLADVHLLNSRHPPSVSESPGPRGEGGVEPFSVAVHPPPRPLPLRPFTRRFRGSSTDVLWARSTVSPRPEWGIGTIPEYPVVPDVVLEVRSPHRDSSHSRTPVAGGRPYVTLRDRLSVLDVQAKQWERLRDQTDSLRGQGVRSHHHSGLVSRAPFGGRTRSVRSLPRGRSRR